MKRRQFLRTLGILLVLLPFRIFPFSQDKKISFKYGVASGDPTNSNVILWTKLSGVKSKKKKVRWEVSDQKDFSRIIAKGHVTAKLSDDFTVKVDARIPDQFNGESIFYRFTADKIYSEIGKTITLPSYNPRSFNIAFCSCSNYPAGYFNSYKEIAENTDIHLVLHLGDYLYEYAVDGYASSNAKEMNRLVEPKHEIISLNDYRKRHATYRKDNDLKKLHANKPMIAVWDDHEFTNDSWKDGAENHQKNEGNFQERKRNALKAYYEWMPIREKGKKEKIWRSFKIGNLINLMMLDTRSVARDKQLDIESYFEGKNFKTKSYKRDLQKPRKLLGNEQFKWIKNNNSNEFKWSIFGQQILIGPKYLPNILSQIDIDEFPSYIQRFRALSGKEIPYNTDQWDGYPKERDKFYKIISNSQANIILAGDSHCSWVSNLYDKSNFIGVEIGAPSISSPNFVDTFGSLVNSIEKSFVESNSDLVWMDGKNKGYSEISVHSDFIEAKFHYVSTVKSKNYRKLKPISFRIEHNKPI